MNKSIIIAGVVTGALIGSAILIDGELDRRHAEDWLYDCLERVENWVPDSSAKVSMQDECLANFVDRGGY